jgi:hypothetical protein
LKRGSASLRTILVSFAIAGGVVAGPAAAQDPVRSDSSGHAGAGHDSHHAGAASDSAFAELQRRGAVVMGVDQYRSAHRFDALPDGGRIELQSLTGDSADVAGIRQHFRDIEAAFGAGDFSKPFEVHAGPVPGTGLMKARKDRIRCLRRDLPSGAELHLITDDADLVRAIHAFLAFQRGDHRAPGDE